MTLSDGSTEGFAYPELSNAQNTFIIRDEVQSNLLTAEYPRCLIDAEGGERQLEWQCHQLKRFPSITRSAS